MNTPSNLLDAVRYFSDLKVCNAYMKQIKWPDGPVCCHNCGSVEVVELSTRPLLKCRDCKKQFSYKVGTIFEDSPLGLDKWFVAVWAIANAKNGISSCELARALGVTQKTAWFMLHRVREAMTTGTFRKLGENGGTVESDETYIGGEARNMHKKVREKKIRGRGGVGKRIVHGMLERGGEVRANVIPAADAAELHPMIHRHVDKSARLCTDEANAYQGLGAHFAHAAINHAVEYVNGEIHTNGIENFWSLFKRCIKGTYIHLAPFHLQRYVDEEVFRFNARKTDDGERFTRVMSQVVGKRLTYRRLCGTDGCGFMGIQ